MKIIIILLMFAAAGTLNAQGGSIGASDARSAAMGKTYTSSSRGVYAIGINPANLTMSEDNHLEISSLLPLPNVNFRMGTDFMSIDEYNYFFGGVTDERGNKVGRYLTQSDKKRLMELFKDGGLVFSDMNIPLFSMTFTANKNTGAFGFSIYDAVSMKVNLPDDLVSLALSGDSAGSTYDFRETEIKGSWIRNYALSYARSLKEIAPSFLRDLSAGISLKMVHGFAYAGTEKTDASLSIGNSNVITQRTDYSTLSAFSPDFGIEYDFDRTETQKNFAKTPFPSPAGKGFGVDLGIAGVVNDYLSFGMSVTDIGKITWNKNTARYFSDTSYVLTGVANENELDTLIDRMKAKGGYTGEFTTGLATALRFGVSLRLDEAPFGSFIPGQMLVTLDYNQGLNNEPRNTTKPRVSLGTEWKPMNWIPYIRTGISIGGLDGFSWALGLGFNTGPIEFNFATSDMNQLVYGNSGKRVSVSLGSRWRF
ncbi:MAG: DUF5723 family protein [Bacteroidota bacterium]